MEDLCERKETPSPGRGELLLKAGCTWNGEQLKRAGAAGTPENPVYVDRYGEGADPGHQRHAVIRGRPIRMQPKQDVAAVHI